jgi:hypothetical protein
VSGRWVPPWVLLGCLLMTADVLVGPWLRLGWLVMIPMLWGGWVSGPVAALPWGGSWLIGRRLLEVAVWQRHPGVGWRAESVNMALT